jgi:hypothetical protein
MVDQIVKSPYLQRSTTAQVAGLRCGACVVGWVLIGLDEHLFGLRCRFHADDTFHEQLSFCLSSKGAQVECPYGQQEAQTEAYAPK